MKQEWKKNEKHMYLPKNQPSLITVPTFKFFSIKGRGNPNDPFFGDYIQVLYALSYAVKMSPKQRRAPEGYNEYTVYPLEGVWDISEEAKANFSGVLDKNSLVFKLMMRQPDFVSDDYAQETITLTKKKKTHRLLEKVIFETLEEGLCIQMLHNGSYDSEPKSFAQMDAFAKENAYQRIGHTHREIYLSDARKVSPDKLKTVLRFKVEQI